MFVKQTTYLGLKHMRFLYVFKLSMGEITLKLKKLSFSLMYKEESNIVMVI